MTRLGKNWKIYYDVEEGFGSARDLYEKARKVDVGITLDMVSAWMRAQPNKQTRNYKSYNSYTAPFAKYKFQIDLMDVTSLLRDVGSETKNQLRYGLVCINIFSKKCHIVPIENKDGDDVYKAVTEFGRISIGGFAIVCLTCILVDQSVVWCCCSSEASVGTMNARGRSRVKKMGVFVNNSMTFGSQSDFVCDLMFWIFFWIWCQDPFCFGSWEEQITTALWIEFQGNCPPDFHQGTGCAHVEWFGVWMQHRCLQIVFRHGIAIAHADCTNPPLILGWSVWYDWTQRFVCTWFSCSWKWRGPFGKGLEPSRPPPITVARRGGASAAMVTMATK